MFLRSLTLMMCMLASADAFVRTKSHMASRSTDRPRSSRLAMEIEQPKAVVGRPNAASTASTAAVAFVTAAATAAVTAAVTTAL